jgi:hypothetical protein
LSSSNPTSSTSRVTLVKYLVVSHEWGKCGIVVTVKGRIRGHL